VRNSNRFKFINNLINTEDSEEILYPADALELGFVLIGANVKFYGGVIIGTDGFGYERDEEGRLVHFPHIGKVVIGNNVSIHGPSGVCRGSLQDTVIGDGTKIAGHCQIGHNAQIGKHCQIGPYVCISGSAKIGDYVTINANTLVDHGAVIGNYSEIGACSYVRGIIPANQLWYGNPIKCVNERWSTVEIKP